MNKRRKPKRKIKLSEILQINIKTMMRVTRIFRMIMYFKAGGYYKQSYRLLKVRRTPLGYRMGQVNIYAKPGRFYKALVNVERQYSRSMRGYN